MPDPKKDPARRRREVRSDHTNVRALVAAARVRGDFEGALVALEARLTEMGEDNFDQREQIRELTEANTALTAQAGKAPEGKTIIDTKEWEAAQAAQKALTTLGVDATAIVAEFPKGRQALLDLSTTTVGQAEGLSEQGAKALKRLVTDHKLHVQTTTTKVDDKDVTRGVVLVDGKTVPLRDYLKQHFAEYEPTIYAGQTTATTASHKPADSRRMPATGTTQRATTTPDAGAAKSDVSRAIASVRARYQPPKPAGSATS